MRRLFQLVMLVCLLHLFAHPAYAEPRTALVIGNSAYRSSPLKNPANDARDIAAALKSLGFGVTVITDATLQQMENAVREFGAKLRNGSVGLFYYAGHGMQVEGENYLIPVDTKIEGEADVKFGALNAGKVLARMEDAGNPLNIVVLDACRTNPFARGFRSQELGLARMDAPKGALIAFATAPGKVAADGGGGGRNSPYTSALLKHMRTPGQKLEDTMKRVRVDVMLATKDKQIPWDYSSLTGDFYFSQAAEVLAPSISVAALTNTQPEKEGMSALAKAEPEKIGLGKRIDIEGKEKDGPTVKSWVELGQRAYDKEDYVEAVKWFSAAAKQGDARALLGLGLMYMKGNGVMRSYNEAYRNLIDSANQGNAYALATIGWLYQNGFGVEKNERLAYLYFSLGYRNGLGAAKSDMEKLATRMSSAQLVEVENDIKFWRARTAKELGYPQ